MKLLRGYAYFRTEPEHAAVGEGGGGVDVDRRGVDGGSEALGGLGALRAGKVGDDSLEWRVP